MSAAQQVPPDLAGESAATTKLQELLLDSYAAMAPVFDGGQTRVAWLAAFALAALRRHAWRPASTPPATLPHGPHYPVTVLAVIDDPRYRINGDEPFVDSASWWPAEKKWTVTHQVRSDAEVADYPCRVVAWQPMLELPPPWSELWGRGARS
jgi:hypothetical protein